METIFVQEDGIINKKQEPTLVKHELNKPTSQNKKSTENLLNVYKNFF